MLKRPFCGMAVCFLLGIISAAYLEVKVWIGLCALIVWVSIMCLAKRLNGDVRRIRVRICLCGAMILLGYWQYQSEQAKRDIYMSVLDDGMQLTVQGEVAGKQYQNNQYVYELTSCFIGPYQKEQTAQEPISCNRILAYSDSDVTSIGEILVLNGTVKLWESAVNEGNFDEKSFYLARKIDFRLNDMEVVSRHGTASAWREGLFQLRTHLQEVYQSTMSEDACGVMATMVLGNKSLLSAETKRLYQTAGLSHVMAISGLHISVIGMTLYRFLRKRELGFLLSGIVAGTLLYGYGTMVGMGTSVQRSVGMFVLLLVAQTLGRAYDSLNALSVMALVLLWENPYLLWDAGFQFSFFAIIGVVWVGSCISFNEMPYQKLREKLFGGVVVQLATLPLVAWHYYEVPMYAVLVNLVVLPFVGVLLMLGIFGGLIGLLTMQGATVVLFIVEKLLDAVRGVCVLCGKLPQYMVIVGRPELWQMICYYVLLFALTIVAYRKKEKQKKEEGKKSEKENGIADEKCKEKKIGISLGKWRLVVRRIAIIAGLLTLITIRTNQGFELDFLDVGQGDGIFLRTEQGHTVFIDGGSTSESKVGTYRILPFLKCNGVRKVEFWFVSHADEDHISGLRELLEAGYEIENLVFAEDVLKDCVYEELCMLAEENDTKVIHVNEGDVLHIESARIHVLYPQENEIESDMTESVKNANNAGVSDNIDVDKNALSLVLWYEEEDFSALFTGDIGSEKEGELCRTIENAYKNGQIRDASLEVYKVAHHGSRYSNSEELLELLQPEISVVSCAKKNNYGHPHEETLKRLEDVGSMILTTPEYGAITVEGGRTFRIQGWKYQ